MERFGDGFRVILPITDPYVAHHGALGSFAQVHLPPHLDAGRSRLAAATRRGDRMPRARHRGAR